MEPNGEQNIGLSSSIEAFKGKFEGSKLSQKIARQKERGEVATALFSDFDGTLFAGDIKKTAQLVQQADERDVPIVAVTGRGSLPLKQVIDDLVFDYNQTHQDQPLGEIKLDAIIGAVGTEIYYAVPSESGGIEYQKDEEYEKQLIEQGFKRPEVAGKLAEIVSELSASHSEFEVSYQREFSEAEQSYARGDLSAKVQPFKISLQFFANGPEELNFVTDYFNQTFPLQRVVICESIGYNSTLEEGDNKKKYCLDILPVTKAEAVDYLKNKLGVEQGLVAGDSGNDSTMLIDSVGLEAALVGGHKDEAAKAVGSAVVNNPDREGRAFQTVESTNGSRKTIYIERSDSNRVGPDTIKHVAEAYRRAAKIKDIKQQRIQQETTKS